MNIQENIKRTIKQQTQQVHKISVFNFPGTSDKEIEKIRSIAKMRHTHTKKTFLGYYFLKFCYH